MKKIFLLLFLIGGLLVPLSLLGEGNRLTFYLGKFSISLLSGGGTNYQGKIEWSEIKFSSNREIWRKNIEEYLKRRGMNARVKLLAFYRIPVEVNGKPYQIDRQEGTKRVYLYAALRSTNFHNVYKFDVRIREEATPIRSSPLIYTRTGMISLRKTTLFYSLFRRRIIKVTLMYLTPY